MKHTIHLPHYTTTLRPLSKPPQSLPKPSSVLLSLQTPMPPQLPKTRHQIPRSAPPPDPLEKQLFFDSIGLDHFSLISSHPPIYSFPLPELRSTVHFLQNLSFTSLELRRLFGICPEILTTRVSELNSVITFLLREAGVRLSDLRHIINRRPRLLVSDVATRLRPTLYFLQMLGITGTKRHCYLLSCSVEEKLIPRIDFLRNHGFSPQDARAMVRRFPPIFCYSIEENLEPKLGFLEEVGREYLVELRRFPQYFSFSLERRIQPRIKACEEKGVVLELPALLRPSDEEFWLRLEVCVGSSPAMRRSRLWYGSFGCDLIVN